MSARDPQQSVTQLLPPGQNCPVLRFENVSVSFGDTLALDRVSFEICQGETRVLFGAAGSGKTTLLKTALGLIKPDSGQVLLFDRDITRLKDADLADVRMSIGMLFQESALFDSLSIEENVAYPLMYQRRAVPPADEILARVKEELSFVGLEHTLSRFPSELSGGMRRRVGIARANVTHPALVMYDSPTAGLDPVTANRIMELIVKGRDLRNTTSLVVSHRLQDGHILADYHYNQATQELDHNRRRNGQDVDDPRTKFLVFREGQLVFEGTERELMASRDRYVMRFARKVA